MLLQNMQYTFVKSSKKLLTLRFVRLYAVISFRLRQMPSVEVKRSQMLLFDTDMIAWAGLIKHFIGNSVVIRKTTRKIWINSFGVLLDKSGY